MRQLLGREIMRGIRESTDMRKYEKRQEVFIAADSLIDVIDDMITESWNESNSHCRYMKEKLGKFLGEIPEIKERCKDPYWKDNERKICPGCGSEKSRWSKRELEDIYDCVDCGHSFEISEAVMEDF